VALLGAVVPMQRSNCAVDLRYQRIAAAPVHFSSRRTQQYSVSHCSREAIVWLNITLTAHCRPMLPRTLGLACVK